MTDSEFLIEFEQCYIPIPQWKHQDHIRMAWSYLKSESVYEIALQKMRVGIQRLNLSHGNSTGYHETVTCLFAIYIYRAIVKAPPNQTFKEFIDVNSWLFDGKNPFRKRHYSDSLWSSKQARKQFVSPDLEPLPGTP
jgi:hypothetical protein